MLSRPDASPASALGIFRKMRTKHLFPCYTHEQMYSFQDGEVRTVRAEQVVELILDAARGNRVLSGGVYRDEPVIRTGRQAFGARGTAVFRSLGKNLPDLAPTIAGPVPEPIVQMRSLARNRSRWAVSYADPKLFYDQARLMERYTDDCPYEGAFMRYYPTYEDMSDAQLRGYFTWRTRYRAGKAPRAPLSFLFVHAYELLCGVGVEDCEEGLRALALLRDTYGSDPGNGALIGHLSTWMVDYAVYHGLDRAVLGCDAEGTSLDRAVAVLAGAERALLATAEPAEWRRAGAGLPACGVFACALAAASRYRMERSRVFSEHFDELGECCAAVFARMVDHCKRRRKRGFVEGLFGDAVDEPYTPFRSAIFYDPVPHPDCTVELMSGVGFRCRSGRWSRYRPHRLTETSAELGDILHEIDRTLRIELGGLPELKARALPAYVRRIVEDEVAACLGRRAAEEAAKVHIDRSALLGIRVAAIHTREALLVDEEREEVPDGFPAQVPETTPAKEPRAVAPIGSGSPFGLSADDEALLRSLLEGVYDAAALLGRGAMASLAIDRINEALFEHIGDTVIEFEGEDPHLVEDYADDVRKALS